MVIVISKKEISKLQKKQEELEKIAREFDFEVGFIFEKSVFAISKEGETYFGDVNVKKNKINLMNPKYFNEVFKLAEKYKEVTEKEWKIKKHYNE